MHDSLGKITFFEPRIKAWLRRRATFGRHFNVAALEQVLFHCGMACPSALVEWERALDELRPSETKAGGPLFTLEDVQFDVLSEIEARLADGKSCVPLGREVNFIPIGRWRHGYFGLADDGGIYVHKMAEAWEPVAVHPAMFLRRIAASALADEEGFFHVVLNSRTSAGRLADALSIEQNDEFTDVYQRWWGQGACLVVEGDIASPGDDVSHTFASGESARALIEACAALGLEGKVQFVAEGTRIERSPGGVAPTAPRRAFRYRSPWERGDGWIGILEGQSDPFVTVRQTCCVAERLVAEVDWPVGVNVEYIRAEIPALSPRGRELLARFDFRLDPRLSCEPGKLREQLERNDLPLYPIVFEVERVLGGLWCPLREGRSRLSFGTHSTFLYDRIYSDIRMLAKSSEVLEQNDEWPRVSFEGDPLVAVGMDAEQVFYASKNGRIMVHDWLEDALWVTASEPIAMLERALRRFELNERRRDESRAPMLILEVGGRVGASLAAELGLPLAEHATDAVVECWSDENEQTWISQQGESTQLATVDNALLHRARQMLEDWKVDGNLVALEIGLLVYEERREPAGAGTSVGERRTVRTYPTVPGALVPFAQREAAEGLPAGPYEHLLTGPTGQPVAVVRGDGGAVREVGAGVYGQLPLEQTGATAVRFVGHWYDDETGLHYNRHRYYDPETGAYLSTEPLGLEGSLKAYAYTDGYPADAVDTNGFNATKGTLVSERRSGKNKSNVTTEKVDASSGAGTPLHPAVVAALPPSQAREHEQSPPVGSCAEPSLLSDYLYKYQSRTGKMCYPTSENDETWRSNLASALGEIKQIESRGEEHGEKGVPFAPCSNCSQMLPRLWTLAGKEPPNGVIKPGKEKGRKEPLPGDHVTSRPSDDYLKNASKNAAVNRKVEAMKEVKSADGTKGLEPRPVEPHPKAGYKLPQGQPAPAAHPIPEQNLGVWTHDPDTGWRRAPGT